jgi:hypothetical protein
VPQSRWSTPDLATQAAEEGLAEAVSRATAGEQEICCRYDGRAEEFSQIGKQDGTGPGFNLLAGPDWSGEIPAVSRRWSARPRRRCSRPRVFS